MAELLVEMYLEFFRVSSDWWLENGNDLKLRGITLRIIELLSPRMVLLMRSVPFDRNGRSIDRAKQEIILYKEVYRRTNGIRIIRQFRVERK